MFISHHYGVYAPAHRLGFIAESEISLGRLLPIKRWLDLGQNLIVCVALILILGISAEDVLAVN